MRSTRSLLPVGVVLAIATGNATAINITASTDAATLTNALLGGSGSGIIVTSSILNGNDELVDLANYGGTGIVPLISSGIYSNNTGTYGIGPGVVLTSGSVVGVEAEVLGPIYGYSDGPDNVDANAWSYGGFGAPATPAQEDLLDPITANDDPRCTPTCSHFDVTELIVNFNMQPGINTISFNIVFGSEEWEEFRESPYIDGFGMFLNGVNIATVGGLPVNIRHPEMRPTLDGIGFPEPGTEIPGTELDGILAPNGNPVLTFSGLVNPTGNTLRFIVADTTDSIYDTTVYFSALTGVVPAPAGVWLLLTGLTALIWRGRGNWRRNGAP